MLTVSQSGRAISNMNQEQQSQLQRLGLVYLSLWDTYRDITGGDGASGGAALGGRVQGTENWSQNEYLNRGGGRLSALNKF